MVFQLESLWNQFAQASGAAVDIEEAIARLAVEVMMMFGCHASQFISITATGHGDGCNFPGFLETTNGTIDRAKAQ